MVIYFSGTVSLTFHIWCIWTHNMSIL